MHNKGYGFTLIELLIVIAIIGILAAVLIPQLLGARIAANKRAVQIHSGNVYKAANSIFAETPSLNMSALAAEIQTKCLLPTSSIVMSSVSYKYGWTSPPVAAIGCVVTPNAQSNGFDITVTGSDLAGGVTSLNGANPS